MCCGLCRCSPRSSTNASSMGWPVRPIIAVSYGASNAPRLSLPTEGRRSAQHVKQRPGLLQISGIKPFGEPAMDLRQQLQRLRPLALALPQARQTHGGAQFEGFGLLATGHFESLLKTRLGG